MFGSNVITSALYLMLPITLIYILSKNSFNHRKYSLVISLETKLLFIHEQIFQNFFLRLLFIIRTIDKVQLYDQ